MQIQKILSNIAVGIVYIMILPVVFGLFIFMYAGLSGCRVPVSEILEFAISLPIDAYIGWGAISAIGILNHFFFLPKLPKKKRG